MKPLRVGIDSRLVPGVSGGIEQLVVGLARGLSRLPDGDEEYLFLTYAGVEDWLTPHLGGRCRILPGRRPPPGRGWRLRAQLLRLGGRYAVSRAARLMGVQREYLPGADPALERAGVDVMHLCKQFAFVTDLPSIYHPHDLQHRHLPQLFGIGERALRELYYRRLCERADVVAVSSSWVKDDLVRQYGLPAEKVAVVPLAAAHEGGEEVLPAELAATRRELELPARFVFYPAQTWPHKNHIALLAALSCLREQHGLRVSLVSAGRLTPHYDRILERARELDLLEQVRFLGFVSAAQLSRLYRLCTCVVIPSRFEAASFPLWEAFRHGAPAVCSTATSLPVQAGDAALVVDPQRPDELAEAIRRLWTEPELRAELVARGRRRVEPFTWERTARHFRAHYRRLAGRPPSADDRALLAASPLL